MQSPPKAPKQLKPPAKHPPGYNSKEQIALRAARWAEELARREAKFGASEEERSKKRFEDMLARRERTFLRKKRQQEAKFESDMKADRVRNRAWRREYNKRRKENPQGFLEDRQHDLAEAFQAKHLAHADVVFARNPSGHEDEAANTRAVTEAIGIWTRAKAAYQVARNAVKRAQAVVDEAQRQRQAVRDLAAQKLI